jgi:hypothetical protein
MAEGAAYLVDEVLPQVPVRQWVLTLPYRLRYRLAWDHALCRAVLGVYARTLPVFYARTARSHGIRDGQRAERPRASSEVAPAASAPQSDIKKMRGRTSSSAVQSQ